MDYARLPRIFGAVFYDTMIVFAIVFIAAQWFPLIPEQLKTNAGVTFLKQIYILGICFLYFAYSWRRGGQTIGMKSWRLKIMQSKAVDTPISLGQCAIRYLVSIVSWLALGGLGFIWVLFNAQHRSWHDMASKTHLIVLPKP